MGAVRRAVLGMAWAAISVGGAFEARAGDGYTAPRTADLDGQTWILEATPDGSKVYLLDLPPLEDDAQHFLYGRDAVQDFFLPVVTDAGRHAPRVTGKLVLAHLVVYELANGVVHDDELVNTGAAAIARMPALVTARSVVNDR